MLTQKKIYEEWIGAVEDYCYACINGETVISWYFFGKVHVYNHFINSSLVDRFWSQVFDSCLGY